MNDTNGALTDGATNGSHSTTAAESSPVGSAGVNGQDSPIPVQPSITSADAAEPKEPAAPPVEKVLDESLDEQDIKVAITLTVHGRKIDIMKRAFEKTFFDGLEQSNRGMLFSSINQFLEQEVSHAIAAKINRKVPYVMPAKPSNGQQQQGKALRQPIPPYTGYTGEDDDPEIKLHESPSLEDCLKANRANGR